MNNHQLTELLIQHYNHILNKPEYEELILAIADDHKKENGQGLSDILLGFVPDDYEQAEHKILIVGRETRGWKLKEPVEKYTPDMIKISMNKSKDWVVNNLIGKYSKGAKGTTFFNFVRKVGDKCGDKGILWANTFALDNKKSHPKHSKFFDLIKQLSKELLQAQIDVLKPDFILFVGGKSSVLARREYFPDLKGDGLSIQGLPIKYLEKFSFEKQQKPICYRTYHPAYRSKNAQKGLNTLIDILPAKSTN